MASLSSILLSAKDKRFNWVLYNQDTYIPINRFISDLSIYLNNHLIKCHFATKKEYDCGCAIITVVYSRAKDRGTILLKLISTDSPMDEEEFNRRDYVDEKGIFTVSTKSLFDHLKDMSCRYEQETFLRFMGIFQRKRKPHKYY